jgi:hypothetical protein
MECKMSPSLSRKLSFLPCLSLALLALAGCGGGVGSTGINPIAAPPPAPPPPPPPPPPSGSTLPLQPPQIGLVSSEPFATFGIGDRYTVSPGGSDEKVLSGPDRAETVQFSYDPQSQSYAISVPNFQAGRLSQIGLNGSAGQVASSTVHKVAGASGALQPLNITLLVPGNDYSRYTYSSYGYWMGALGKTAEGREIYAEGLFAYGIPTRSGDVPTSGTARYGAEVVGSIGNGYSIPVTGTAELNFDFGAGTLSGYMHPEIADSFDGIFQDYGRYDFTQTVYARGGTGFSGRFVVPGIAGGTERSFFEGAFTGPGAAELVARWQAPYQFNGQQGTISGIWLGRKN